MEQFDYCRVCGVEHTPDIKEWARKRFEQKCCSTECMQIEIKRNFACCMEAEPLACVCMYAFTCAKHGERHIGTHD